MRTTQHNIFHNVDIITVSLYLILVLMGWLNIYAAVYNDEHQHLFDMSQKYGKQLLWIISSLIIAVILLLIQAKYYPLFSYFLYLLFLTACLLVPYFGKEIKGSRSWFRVGEFGIQPAEFMKFATNLAIAKYLSNRQLNVKSHNFNKIKAFYFQYKAVFVCVCLFAIPLVIIKVLQLETGLAIVFVSFIVVLYREGLSINFLLICFGFTILFILSLIYPIYYMFIVITIIGILTFTLMRRKTKSIIYLLLFLAASYFTVFETNVLYNKLEKHQKTRIDVLLGRGNINVKKEGYNVNQSKIAIGSGGFLGKGFLQGTQTKYEFVPEQDTDFIFCTVGEEWGLVGSFIVIVLELGLILRVMYLAERQRSKYSKLYGYGVASILFFHTAINIGMTIGLVPVIGIPLPFFSYGGSSLWSFTILLFVMIKMDTNRLLILR